LHAQDATGNREGYRSGIEEVVVTARRKEERLQDVPVTINAIDGGMLMERGIFNTEDLMGAIPNVQISSFVGSATPNITIRGVGVGSEFNASATSPIGVYIDEDYQAFRPAHGVQFFDLERVEVVKGPQGTLYGRNTTGGALNIISKKPSLGESDDYVTARYGNYNAYTLEGAKEFTLVPDVLGVRFAGNLSKADGFIENESPNGVNVTNDDFGQTDSTSARLTVRYKPTESLDFVLKTYWAESDPVGTPPIMKSILPSGGDASGYSRAGLDKDEAQPNSQGEMLNRTKGAVLRATVALGDAVVTSVTGYNDSLYDVQIDCDGGINNICNHNLITEYEHFNEDLRVNFTFDRWDAIIGLYYGEQTVESDNSLNYFGFIEDFFPSIPFNPPIGSPDAISSGLFDPTAPITGIHAQQRFEQVSIAKAIYGEVNYELTESLDLTLGARWTKDETEYNDALTVLKDNSGNIRASTIPFSFPFDSSVGFLERDADTDELTGRVILDYKFGDDAHAFASYSRGYRSGAFNGFAYQSVEQIYFVEPEIVDAYEIGVKSRLGDGRYQLNGSIFYYDYQDQQVQEVIGAIGFLRSISGEVRGAELEAVAQITPDLTVNSSLGLLDTEYDDDQIISGKDVGGNSWPFAPEMTFNIHADWIFAETERGVFRLMPEAQYSDSYYYDIFNVSALEQESYWLMNGRISYEDNRGFSVAIWGKNITDKYYEPWGADTADFGANYYIRGMPRTYGIEFSMRF
jgi:iron complex outermembrane receptor protein